MPRTPPTLARNPVRLLIHDLDADNGGRVFVEEDDREVTALRKEIHAWIEDIQAGDISRTRNCQACAACDFVPVGARPKASRGLSQLVLALWPR